MRNLPRQIWAGLLIILCATLFNMDAAAGPVPMITCTENKIEYARPRVCLDGDSRSSIPASLLAALHEDESLELVDSESQCDLTVEVQTEPDGNKTVYSVGSTSIHSIDSKVLADNPYAVEALRRMIDRWRIWFALGRLENPVPANSIDFEFRIVLGPNGSDAIAEQSAVRIELAPQDLFRVEFENRSDRSLYFALLDLSSDGTVASLYPPGYAGPQAVGAGQLVSQQYEAFIPEGSDFVVDVLKVFVTTAPVDFGVVTGGPVSRRGHPDDSQLARLLRDNVSAGISSAEACDDWTTQSQKLIVRKTLSR